MEIKDKALRLVKTAPSSDSKAPKTIKEDADNEKPENGIKGLRHWKQDLVAGLVVSLVSVPLSLGIAVASGAPPVAGLISSIIAGLIFPFLGGAYVTISGPAAGLAPVIYVAILALGQGHMDVGYKLCLAVISIAGLLQIILSYLKAAKLSTMFPSSAIEGMLASIGLLIIAKQIPNFIGHPFKAHEFFGLIAETPSELLALDPKAFAIAAICLVILFGSIVLKNTRLKNVPPQLIAVIAGIVLGKCFGLDDKFMIHIKDNVFHSFVFPDFSGLFHDSKLWITALGCAVTLTLVDGCESLATIMAIDNIDPFRRKSNPDRTLFAMGVSNLLSSLAGGLTIIPGGIKSTTCIISGGRTLWANFYNALFLVLYVGLGRELINSIPLGCLAAILIHIGYKLCGPARWIKVSQVGVEQLVIFSATVLVTLSTDLLWGLLFGTAVKFLLTLFYSLRNSFQIQHKVLCPSVFMGEVARIFKNPVCCSKKTNNAYIVEFNGPVVCFNLNHVAKELEKVPNDKKVILHFSPEVGIIDHTSAARLQTFKIEHARMESEVEFVGMEQMCMKSQTPACMRHSVRKRSA